jgi:tetratricopeptide (TPR) repeat protein
MDLFRARGQISMTLDRAFRRYAASQLRSLWDLFHVTEERSSIRTLSAMVAGYQQTLHQVADLAHGDGDRIWVSHMLCEADLLGGRIARDELAFERAIQLHKRALTHAREFGESTVLTASAMRLAETLLEAGFPYDALGYCLAAEPASTRTNPRIRGEPLGLTAEVHSTLGYHRESEHLIDKAATLSPGAAALPTAGGINFSETAAAEYQANISLRSGNSQAALAHIQRAHESLALEFADLPNARWEAHLLLDAARIHQQRRDLEFACHALRQAAHQAGRINSWITLRKIQEAARELGQRYPREHAVAELHDKLMSLSCPDLQE